MWIETTDGHLVNLDHVAKMRTNGSRASVVLFGTDGASLGVAVCDVAWLARILTGGAELKTRAPKPLDTPGRNVPQADERP